MDTRTARDAGAGCLPTSRPSKGPREAQEDRDLESPRKTKLEIPGMELKQGMPVVFEQITKTSSLNKLHASVSQTEFKEIHQNNLPLGGRVDTYVRELEVDNLLENISGYQIEFQAKLIQVIISNSLLKMERKILISKIKTASGVCSISDKRSEK